MKYNIDIVKIIIYNTNNMLIFFGSKENVCDFHDNTNIYKLHNITKIHKQIYNFSICL